MGPFLRASSPALPLLRYPSLNPGKVPGASHNPHNTQNPQSSRTGRGCWAGSSLLEYSQYSKFPFTGAPAKQHSAMRHIWEMLLGSLASLERGYRGRTDSGL